MPALKNTWATNDTYTAADQNDVANAVNGLNLQGLFGSRPTASFPGRLYLAIDNGMTYRDNGTGWDLVTAADPWPGTPGDSSLWTAVNLGTATFTHDRDTILVTAPTNGSTNSVRLYVKPLSPTSNYTITARIDTVTAPSADFWEMGLVLRNSSSGALVTHVLRWGSGAKINVVKYNSATSANSNYVTPITLANNIYPSYLRIRDNGTNRFFDYSFNGFDWINATSHARTDFITPDQYGIATDAYSQAVSMRLRTLSIT